MTDDHAKAVDNLVGDKLFKRFDHRSLGRSEVIGDVGIWVFAKWQAVPQSFDQPVLKIAQFHFNANPKSRR